MSELADLIIICVFFSLVGEHIIDLIVGIISAIYCGIRDGIKEEISALFDSKEVRAAKLKEKEERLERAMWED